MRCIFCGWPWFQVSVSWVFTFAGLGFRFVVGLVAVVLVSVFGEGCVDCGFWFYVGWVCLFAEMVWWFWVVVGGFGVSWLLGD